MSLAILGVVAVAAMSLRVLHAFDVEQAIDPVPPVSLEFELASMVVPTVLAVEGAIRVRCNLGTECVVPQSWFDSSVSDGKVYLCIKGPVDVADEAEQRLDVEVGWLAGNCKFTAEIANPGEEVKAVWANDLGELGYADTAAAEELHDGGTLQVVVPVGVGRVALDTGNELVGEIQVHDVMFRVAGATYSVHVELRKGGEVLLQSAATTLVVVDCGVSAEVVGAVSELLDDGRGGFLILGCAAYTSPAIHVGKAQNEQIMKAMALVPEGTSLYESLLMLNVEHRLGSAVDFVGEHWRDPTEHSSEMFAHLKDVAACQASLDALAHHPKLQPRRLAWAKERAALLTEALSK